jgi:Flp pilus assembly protein TadD
MLALTVVLVIGVGLLVSRMLQPVYDTPAGKADLAAAVHTAPQQEVDLRFQQAVMMLHSRQYDYAVTSLKRVLALAPRMPEAHANMGYALLGQGHHEAARDYFYSAIDLRPRQVNAYWGLAVSLEALCDFEGATGAMRSYVHLSGPEDPFLPRARAALWEWDAANASGDSKQAASTGSGPVPGQCGQAAG